MLQYIFLVFSVLSRQCYDIKQIKLTLLELNKDCMQKLVLIDNKWIDYKIEIKDIEYLCHINAEKYEKAVHELHEKLSHDLNIASNETKNANFFRKKCNSMLY